MPDFAAIPRIPRHFSVASRRPLHYALPMRLSAQLPPRKRPAPHRRPAASGTLRRPVSQTDLATAEVTETVAAMLMMFGQQAGMKTGPTTKLPALACETYLQDGNWFVISDMGDTFVNNERKTIARPQFLKGNFPKQEPIAGVSTLYLPKAEVIPNLLEQKTPRDFARELGNAVRESPQQIKTQKVRTVEALRGRTLR